MVSWDNVLDQNWSCELDRELLMVSPDIENKDDKDVDHHCEDTQQEGKNICIQIRDRDLMMLVKKVFPILLGLL